MKFFLPLLLSLATALEYAGTFRSDFYPDTAYGDISLNTEEWVGTVHFHGSYLQGTTAKFVVTRDWKPRFPTDSTVWSLQFSDWGPTLYRLLHPLTDCSFNMHTRGTVGDTHIHGRYVSGGNVDWGEFELHL